MKIFKRIVIVILLIAVALAAVFFWNVENNKVPVTTFYQVDSSKNIKGVRIVQLCDLHLKEFGEGNKLLLDIVARLKPDIIAVVGDMTTSRFRDYSVAWSFVKRLCDIAPVYYSLGNHEYTDILHNKNTTLVADIEATGAHFIENAYERVTVKGYDLVIGGICKNAYDLRQYKSTTGMLEKFCQESDFRLLLSHYPEVFFDQMEGYPVDLALCGHAHGGMIRLPFTDGLYSPDQGFLPKLTSGKSEHCGSTVIVSRGLGESREREMRIFNPPEVVVIDIN